MRPASRRTLALFGALGAVGALLVFVAAVGRRPLAYVTRDPQATVLERWFLGFFANVGSALWWLAAGVATITGIVLVTAAAGRARAHDDGQFMLGVAAVTAVLAIDDMFGVHDVWGYEVGVPKGVFFAAYAALAIALVVRFRREVARTWTTPLVLAVGLYAFSSVFDWVSGASDSDIRYLGEDGGKLLAIVAWAAWVGHSAYVRLRDEVSGAAALPYD